MQPQPRHCLALASLCVLSTLILCVTVLTLPHSHTGPWPWEHTNTALVASLALLVVATLALLIKRQQELLRAFERNQILAHEVAFQEHAHETLAARTSDLEIEVARRTEALQEQATRMLKLYQMAYDFVGNVSHEFRTPLTVIKEYVAALEEAVEGADIDPDVQRFFAVIHGRVDDLSLMVDDLIDVTRLESDILRVSRRPCRVEDIVTRAQEMVLAKARKSQITLEFMADPELPDVYCDPEKIGRVIINLVTNAVKFSPPESAIRVWALHDQGDGLVRIGVTDHGPGIPRESRSAIFERFKQVTQENAPSTKGFGLGLHIAKELVGLNFGDINVHSSIGVGSVFSFTVPTWNPSSFLQHYLRHIGYFRQACALVSLVRVEATGGSREGGDELGAFLEDRLRRTDLAFRTGLADWLIMVPMGQAQGLPDLLQRLRDEHEQANHVRPLNPLLPIHLEVLGTWTTADASPDLETAFLAALAHDGDTSPPAPATAASDRLDTRA